MASILLIDDDDAFCSVTAEILRQAGHTVNIARDGRTGLEHHRAKPHDLIITDIVMPTMEGLELIADLRHEAPRPRIIAISGNSNFSKPLYLHLKNARFFGGPSELNIQTGWWRGRLSAVDGFFLGELT